MLYFLQIARIAGSGPLSQDPAPFHKRIFQVFLAKGDHRSFIALNIETGALPKTLIQTSLHISWAICDIHVSNGMLYVPTSPFETEAYDILTGKLVCKISFGWFKNISQMQVFDNKLVYLDGNRIRMMELDE